MTLIRSRSYRSTSIIIYCNFVNKLICKLSFLFASNYSPKAIVQEEREGKEEGEKLDYESSEFPYL